MLNPRSSALLFTVRKNEAVHSACPVKYDELLQAGYDFVELVAVHGSSMELVEMAALMDDRELPLSRKPSNKTFIIVTIESNFMLVLYP